MCSVGDAPGLRITCLQSQNLDSQDSSSEWISFLFLCTSLPWQCSWKYPSFVVPLQHLCFEIFPIHCKFYTCTWAQLHIREEREIIALFQNLVSCLENMFRHQRCTHYIKSVQKMESNTMLPSMISCFDHILVDYLHRTCLHQCVHNYF